MMSPELRAIREKLIQRWLAIPEFPPAEERDALVSLAEQLVHLVGWIDEHPAATREEYREELARIRSAGIVWPAAVAMTARHEPHHGGTR